MNSPTPNPYATLVFAKGDKQELLAQQLVTAEESLRNYCKTNYDAIPEGIHTEKKTFKKSGFTVYLLTTYGLHKEVVVEVKHKEEREDNLEEATIVDKIKKE